MLKRIAALSLVLVILCSLCSAAMAASTGGVYEVTLNTSVVNPGLVGATTWSDTAKCGPLLCAILYNECANHYSEFKAPASSEWSNKHFICYCQRNLQDGTTYIIAFIPSKGGHYLCIATLSTDGHLFVSGDFSSDREISESTFAFAASMLTRSLSEYSSSERGVYTLTTIKQAAAVMPNGYKLTHLPQ